MNCIVRELCGENGGESIRDLPLTNGVLGHNLAEHLHLGWKHNHDNSHKGRGFF